jgi:hypothetical protein
MWRVILWVRLQDSHKGPAEDNLQIGDDTKIIADPRAEDVGELIYLG